uniref:Uncharacterized protein LOC111101248 isoform X2 n=1 Tax=Crassostrea virginica TaxID=6565 RepID=A0A8B8AFU4_CRAVI|nr:uncharacterized protein LOC111101248 isoform X2 [Crassostrea virginica]
MKFWCIPVIIILFGISEIEKVSSCPVTEQEYNEAARRKKCSSTKSTCTNQMVQLEYHCLPNAWGNKFFEMCATSEEIIGNSCAEYNELGERIQSNFERKCNGADFDVKCPFKYFANKIYLYPACLTISEETTKTPGKENSTDSHSMSNDYNNLPVLIVFPFVSLLIGLVLCIFFYWMWRRLNGDTNDTQNIAMQGTRVTTEEEILLDQIKIKDNQKENLLH